MNNITTFIFLSPIKKKSFFLYLYTFYKIYLIGQAHHCFIVGWFTGGGTNLILTPAGEIALKALFLLTKSDDWPFLKSQFVQVVTLI